MGPQVHWITQRLDDVPRHNDWLGPSEIGVLDSKKIVKRRADWRLGRWTAKRALQTCFGAAAPDYPDIEVIAAEDGAPEAYLFGEPAPASISLSHSHGVALCAVGEQGVSLGCDIERIEPRSDAFVSDYFSASERELVLTAAPGERALISTLIWSAKESALKALREGLRIDTRDVVVDISARNSGDDWLPLTVRHKESARAFSGWWRQTGDFLCTVLVISSPR